MRGLLPEFLKANPGAQVELIISNQSIDLGKSEADVALRLGSPGQDSLYATRVASVGFGLYASKEYVRLYGLPENDADLLKHRFIGMSGKLARFEPSVWLNDFAPHENVWRYRPTAWASAISRLRMGSVLHFWPVS